MQFSRPEYWSGYPFRSPGDHPNPGIEPRSPERQVDSLPTHPQGNPRKTGVGSLTLLQRIFLTQEWEVTANWYEISFLEDEMYSRISGDGFIT